MIIIGVLEKSLGIAPDFERQSSTLQLQNEIVTLPHFLKTAIRKGWLDFKTAWFLALRIREAMASGDRNAISSGGGIFEADETFIGRIKGIPKRRAFHPKIKVLALIDRDTDKAPHDGR